MAINTPYSGSAPSRRGKILLAPIMLALIYIAFQYFSAETFINPETGEKERVALSSEQEEALGLQSFREVLSQSEVVSSGPEYNMVKRVAERMIQVVDGESKKFNWSAELIKGDQINAFCLPGGKIAVFTGILPVTANETGLAAVVGHEIAHATARHGAQRLFREQLVQAGLLGIQGAVSDLEDNKRVAILAALGAGVQFGIVLPYSREHEFEADKIGLRYVARAGYDPREAVKFWERMQQMSERNPPQWASTHPSHDSRIQRLNEMMPEALKVFEERTRPDLQAAR